MEEIKNVVVEIAGYGDKEEAIKALCDILSGYSQYAIDKLSVCENKKIADSTKDKIMIIRDLIEYAQNGNIRNDS